MRQSAYLECAFEQTSLALIVLVLHAAVDVERFSFARLDVLPQHPPQQRRRRGLKVGPALIGHKTLPLFAQTNDGLRLFDGAMAFLATDNSM